MADRIHYDSAMFWLPFGTAAAVIGLALMALAGSRLPAGANLLSNPLFDGGFGLLLVGAGLLLWSLGLYIAHRRGAGSAPAGGSSKTQTKDEMMRDAVHLYYAERDKLFHPPKEDEEPKS
jgi:hypothetical protein